MMKLLNTRQLPPAAAPQAEGAPAAIAALARDAEGDRAALVARGEALGARLAHGETLNAEEALELRRLVVLGLISTKRIEELQQKVAEARATATTLARFEVKIAKLDHGMKATLRQRVEELEAELRLNKEALLRHTALSTSLALGRQELQALVDTHEQLWPAGTRAQAMIDDARRKLEGTT